MREPINKNIATSGYIFMQLVYKPGSVKDDYLSRLIVTYAFKRFRSDSEQR